MGVTVEKGRFRARITVKGKRFNLGSFDTELKAKRALSRFRRANAAPIEQLPYKPDDTPFSDGFHTKPSLSERITAKIRSWAK